MSSITVGVRMRPLVPHEQGQVPCLKILEPADVEVIPDAPVTISKGAEGPWRFDYAMDSSDKDSPLYTDNAICYTKMGRPMVDQCLQGFNVCLFCYGQTGTGKTTTIMGDPQNGEGLLIKLLADIFVEAEKFRAGGASCEVSVQMLEVYNETLHDLLLDNRAEMLKTKVNVHMLPSGAQLQGALSKPVESVKECMEHIDHGNEMKTIAATAMNPQSSRGHTVFRLLFHKSGGSDGELLDSEVYFADLAGHENEKTTHVTGERLKELTFINKSLMWLQNAIHSLGKPHKGHADMGIFRNSKLTMLLSPALTGNSRTAIIVTLSPAAAHFDTSISSLKFAVESKSIKIDAKASKHLDPNVRIKELEAEVKELKAEAREFKEKLALAEAGGFVAIEGTGSTAIPSPTGAGRGDGDDGEGSPSDSDSPVLRPSRGSLRKGGSLPPDGEQERTALQRAQQALMSLYGGEDFHSRELAQRNRLLVIENEALKQELEQERVGARHENGLNGNAERNPSKDVIRECSERTTRCLELTRKTAEMAHYFVKTKSAAVQLSMGSFDSNGDFSPR